MVYRSIKALHEDLLSGKTTCSRVLASYLNAIEDNNDLNAYVEVYHAAAKKRARELDQKLARKEKPGKLFGVVTGIKDVISHKGNGLSASSRILQGYNAVYDATVIKRLEKEDAIIIGRLNCDEFAMGSTNESSYYGAAKNPLDRNRVAGGSSGGSAAAVRAGLCTVSLGSDTGGSVRQPASFCGVVGLKPTYGRVSRYGLIAYGSSFDQIGPIANNVEDAALILEIIAGRDVFDATTADEEVAAFSENIISTKPENYTIGIYEDVLDNKSLDKEVRDVYLNLIEKARSEGHKVVNVRFSEMDYIVPAYYVLTTAEASSNLARYDGMRYGYRSKEARDLASAYKKTRTEGFGMEVKRRIMCGAFVLSAGYYDAYYSKAQKVRRMVAEKTNNLLEQLDFIVCPTAPGTAYKLGEMVDDPVKMYLGDIFTVQANMAGIPAISLPLGNNAEGLPVGMQIMAGKFKEEKLLKFSKALMN